MEGTRQVRSVALSVHLPAAEHAPVSMGQGVLAWAAWVVEEGEGRQQQW